MVIAFALFVLAVVDAVYVVGASAGFSFDFGLCGLVSSNFYLPLR